MKKLAIFQSLLKEKHLLPGVSLEERKEFESQLESAFTELLIAFEEELVDPWKEKYEEEDVNPWKDKYECASVNSTHQFSMYTGIKERADIPFQCRNDENTKSNKFQLLMEEMGREGVLSDYLDKIGACIKNRRFPRDKLGSLYHLVVNLNEEEIESNQSLLRDMVEICFKETEQSVFRSFRLEALVIILNKTEMMGNYMSRLKSLISDIMTAMEADDEYEYHMWAFFHLLPAIKRTDFMDYFYPRIEQLFRKLLRVEHENDLHHEKDPFWSSEDFIFEEIEDTKLLDVFKEWSRKNST